jgi:phenylpropionate dioxygenase-like ring-hydroxylating dioxygenase large terminal subunit
MSGAKRIYLSDSNTGEHSFVFKGGKKNFIDVPTTSLDKFISENKIKRIDFLKMDCEGAEYEILFGSRPETLRKISRISMEYHPIDSRRNAGTLKKFLIKNGFEVKVEDSIIPLLYAKRDEKRLE